MPYVKKIATAGLLMYLNWSVKLVERVTASRWLFPGGGDTYR
jgi:hypothetical protein